MPVRVAAAGADPDAATAIAGCGPHAVGERGQQRGARWACTARWPAAHRAGYDGTPRSSSTTAGGGTGRRPCSVATVPPPTDTGETTTRAEAEVHEAGADADDVGDRVQRADLVEVHVERVAAVHRPSASASRSKTSCGQRADVLVQAGRVEQAADVAPGAVVRGVGDLDVAPGGREAVRG